MRFWIVLNFELENEIQFLYEFVRLPSSNSIQHYFNKLHRAEKEAQFINSTNHEVLKYVGGKVTYNDARWRHNLIFKVSLEHQIPKLLWIKKNLPEAWSK